MNLGDYAHEDQPQVSVLVVSCELAKGPGGVSVFVLYGPRAGFSMERATTYKYVLGRS